MGHGNKAHPMKMMTVGEAVVKSTAFLEQKGIESPRLDAELLLCRILGTDRLHLYMDWQKPLTELEVAGYREFLRRRGIQREPVARILGRRAFYRHELLVEPGAFVPRPETEGVVERALQLLQTEPALTSQRQTVFEIGTGSGCIITSIAAEADGHHFIASDLSAKALETARRNARELRVEGRIEFRLGALFAGWQGTLGLLVSNPPYIRSSEIPELPPEVRLFDPMEALDGGPDGLMVIREIAAQAPSRLISGGWVVLEIGEDQGAEIITIFEATGNFERVRVERDLAGRERYLLARRR